MQLFQQVVDISVVAQRWGPMSVLTAGQRRDYGVLRRDDGWGHFSQYFYGIFRPPLRSSGPSFQGMPINLDEL